MNGIALGIISNNSVTGRPTGGSSLKAYGSAKRALLSLCRASCDVRRIGRRCAALLAAALCVAAPSWSVETATYTYDALGRLTQAAISGGPSAGVQRGYQYDRANNRTQVQVTGASGSAAVNVSSLGSVSNGTSSGAVIGVKVSGDASPGGMVTFSENGVYLGSAFVMNGQATVFLEGFALGTHTITAVYAGDGFHEPSTYTFTITVRNLSWLPAVLDLLLQD